MLNDIPTGAAHLPSFEWESIRPAPCDGTRYLTYALGYHVERKIDGRKRHRTPGGRRTTDQSRGPANAHEQAVGLANPDLVDAPPAMAQNAAGGRTSAAPSRSGGAPYRPTQGSG